MAKYIVTDGSEKGGPFESGEMAAVTLIGALSDALQDKRDPTKWHIEEIPEEAASEPEKPKDVPEMIPDYTAALDYINADGGYGVPEGVCEAMDAFRDLTVLCKAWNKADGFEPDWENFEKYKFAPIIGIGDDGIGISADSYRHLIKPFVFATSERAMQFGEKFIGLFKQLYGIREGE